MLLRAEGPTGFVAGETMMKKLLTGTILALAGAAHAAAADLAPKSAPAYKAPPPVVAAPAWSGLYLGLGLGARRSVADASLTAASDSIAGNLLTPAFCNAVTPCAPGQSLDSTTFRASPYIGYNWQIGPEWLIGLEGDWSWTKGGRTLSGMFVPGGNAFTGLSNGQPENTYAINASWDASIRARLGWIMSPAVMAYVTGGVAWLRVEQISVCGASNNDDCILGGFGPATIADATTRTGWTLGGGLEAMLGNHWIVRGEYRYADFGTWSATDTRTCAIFPTLCFVPPPVTLVTTTDIRIRTHTATFGLAYKF
jgi:outer membrane immunogenic protein